MTRNHLFCQEDRRQEDRRQEDRRQKDRRQKDRRQMSSFILKSQANVGVKSNESLKDLHHFLVTCVLVFLTIVFVSRV